MRILVTGIAGFIGSRLAERFLDLGEVRGLDDLSNGRRENVPPGVEFVEGDVRDASVCREACRGVDVVFHEAALASVPRSIEDPESTTDVNVRGTLNMLRAAMVAGVRRFVYAASSSAYGTVDGPCDERMAPHPLSPYAASKLAAELYCSAFQTTYGFRTISLRYFNIFGPGQQQDGPYAAVVAKWADALLGGRELVVHGDGLQTRDFTYIDNVIEANRLAGFADLSDEAFGEAYNIGCGRRVSLLELADAMGLAFRQPVRVQHGPPRSADPRNSLADVSKASRLLSYAPGTGLVEGLHGYAQWLRSRR